MSPNNKWFFMGLVDDRVKEFPRNGVDSTKNPLDQLIQAVLIGRRPLIHQSVMLIQYPFVEDLAKEEKSVIRALSAAHQLRIISSEGDFEYWVKEKIKHGIYSSWWHTHDDKSIKVSKYLQDNKTKIERAGKFLKEKELFLAFPRRNPSSVLFESLLQLKDWNPPKEIPRAIWDAFFPEFLRRFREDLAKIEREGKSETKYPGTRTHWEGTVRQVCAHDWDLQTIMMAIVNEHYHATFAATLSDELGDPKAIGVATIGTGNYHGYSLEVAEPKQNKTEDIRGLPSIRYNASAVREGLHEFADDLFGSSPLGKSRSAFIDALAGPFDSASKQERFHKLAKEYEEELARKFKYWDDLNRKEFNYKKNIWIDIFVALTAGAIAAVTDVTKGNLGSAYQFEQIIPFVINSAEVAGVAGMASRLIEPVIRGGFSLVTQLNLTGYDKLRPEINYGTRAILIENNDNPLYLQCLFAGSEIRTLNHPEKLKLNEHQLRVT